MMSIHFTRFRVAFISAGFHQTVLAALNVVREAGVIPIQTVQPIQFFIQIELYTVRYIGNILKVKSFFIYMISEKMKR